MNEKTEEHSPPSATKLCFPESVLNQHLVMLGKTGAGKSSALRHVVEHLLARRKRVCVVDPKGDWWGLKVSADGKGPGFPVIMFGDFKETKATDVPINAQSGRHVADLIASGNRPCVIGFRGWRTSDMLRFWIDFAAALFTMNTGELFVVGDEFHNFAPKGKVLSPQAGESLHWANRLLSEGRGLGLTFLLASQRPQKVHNDTLTSCETLVAMRVIHAADRAAIKDWVDGAGDPKLGKTVLDALAGLPRGEAYVWSPEIGFGPERLAFPFFTTFDSFAPPQIQKKVSSKGWADVNLDEVKAKLASVIEEAKANDVGELKKTIAALRKEIATAAQKTPATASQSAPVVEKAPRVIERYVVTDTQIERLSAMQRRSSERIDALVERIAKLTTPLLAMLKEHDAKLGAVYVTAMRVRNPIDPPAAPLTTPRARDPDATAATAVGASGQTTNSVAPAVGGRVSVSRGDASPEGSIGKFEQKVLDALAWWQTIGEATPSRPALAVIAGYVVGGRFNNVLGGLRTAGLIDYPADGTVALTDAGAALAKPPKVAPSLEGVHDAWKAKLDASQWKLVEHVIHEYPASMSAEELAAATDYTVGGRFNNILGSLRSLGVLTKKGPIAATALLYPEGLK